MDIRQNFNRQENKEHHWATLKYVECAKCDAVHMIKVECGKISMYDI